jgi:hypothetical protein
LALGFVEHQQMITELVEGIELATDHGHLAARFGVHFFAKDAEPQFLGRRDLGRRLGQPDPQVSGSNVHRPR